jgi:hypothetical protein
MAHAMSSFCLLKRNLNTNLIVGLQNAVIVQRRRRMAAKATKATKKAPKASHVSVAPPTIATSTSSNSGSGSGSGSSGRSNKSMRPRVLPSIQNVLRSYPYGTGVLKELIQVLLSVIFLRLPTITPFVLLMIECR